MSLLAVEGLSLAIHGLPILHEVSMARPAGRGARGDRRERLGQVADRARGDAAPAARRRGAPGASASTAPT